MPRGVGYGSNKLPDKIKKRLREENDLTRMTEEQMNDMVRRRTKAGAKTEGITKDKKDKKKKDEKKKDEKKEEKKKDKKKEKRKRTEKFGRTADRNSNLQEFEAQFVKNKSNFVTRRNMLRESQVSKNIKAGKTNVGKVNKIFASIDKNKATLIKKRKRK